MDVFIHESHKTNGLWWVFLRWWVQLFKWNQLCSTDCICLFKAVLRCALWTLRSNAQEREPNIISFWFVEIKHEMNQNVQTLRSKQQKRRDMSRISLWITFPVLCVQRSLWNRSGLYLTVSHDNRKTYINGKAAYVCASERMWPSFPPIINNDHSN